MGPPTPAKQAQDRAGEIYNRYLVATKQDTSLGPLIPVVYRLRLEKIARNCHKLETEVLAMGKYARSLHRPNQNTDGAHRDFRKNLDLLEEDLFKLIEKYTVALNHKPIHQLQRDLRDLSVQIEGLTLSCTLSVQLPDVQGAVLKSLDCPNLFVSSWIIPGYYTTIKKREPKCCTTRHRPHTT